MNDRDDTIEYQIAELERPLAEATPGPWRAVIGPDQPVCYYRALIGISHYESGDPDQPGYISVVQDDERRVESGQWAPNAALIAAMRNALPGLIAALKSERERADLADGKVRALREMVDGRDAALRQLMAAVNVAAHHLAGPGASEAAAALSAAMSGAHDAIGDLATADTMPPAAADEADARVIEAQEAGDPVAFADREKERAYGRMREALRALPGREPPEGWADGVWAEIEKGGE